MPKCPEAPCPCPSGVDEGVSPRGSSPTPVSFVLFWQNQLLAKGLLFVEEKIKLCEGKYKATPVQRGL